ncbi:MAG: DUF4920 domain-containing protein [Candidatus Kapabacteria bacterium]|nr:DUF4920 domain-containing protein [Candidatus Kapabacteria bacterium]
MRVQSIVVSITSSLVLIFMSLGCTKANYIGVAPDETRNVLAVSDAIRPENLGRIVTIRGKVGAVCQDEGCWLSVTDGTAELTMRFSDSQLAVPMDLRGTVLAEGIVREQIVGSSRIPEMDLSGVKILE